MIIVIWEIERDIIVIRCFYLIDGIICENCELKIIGEGDSLVKFMKLILVNINCMCFPFSWRKYQINQRLSNIRLIRDIYKRGNRLTYYW